MEHKKINLFFANGKERLDSLIGIESEWAEQIKAAHNGFLPIDAYPSAWEYYYRRGNRYYFRHASGDKIMAELSEIIEEMPKHYGKIELTFGI